MLCAPMNSVIEDLHQKLKKIIPKEEILIYQAMKYRNGSYIGPKAIEAARVVICPVTTSGNQILRKYTYDRIK